MPERFSQKRRVFESASKPSLHVTILVVIATICVVHAQTGFTNVDIVVEVPEGFLKPDVVVFTNEDNDNVIDTKMYNGTVLVYGKIQ